MTTSTRKGLSFNVDSESVAAIVFAAPGFLSDTTFVIENVRSELDAFRQRYGDNAKRATGVALNECGARFYLMYVEDCFDPCLAIVRADNESEAVETFLDALDWCDIDAPDLADYTEERLMELPYTDERGGKHCDTEALRGVEVQLHTIKFAF
jgi:hypothetical protein